MRWRARGGLSGSFGGAGQEGRTLLCPLKMSLVAVNVTQLLQQILMSWKMYCHHYECRHHQELRYPTIQIPHQPSAARGNRSHEPCHGLHCLAPRQNLPPAPGLMFSSVPGLTSLPVTGKEEREEGGNASVAGEEAKGLLAEEAVNIGEAEGTKPRHGHQQGIYQGS